MGDESSEVPAASVWGILKVALLQVQFTEDHGAIEIGDELLCCWKWIFIQDDDCVHGTQIHAKAEPPPQLLFCYYEVGDPGRGIDGLNNPKNPVGLSARPPLHPAG